MNTPDWGRNIQNDCANHASEMAKIAENEAALRAQKEALINGITANIRGISNHDFDCEIAAALIAALSSKIAASTWANNGYAVSAVESLDSAFDDLS